MKTAHQFRQSNRNKFSTTLAAILFCPFLAAACFAQATAQTSSFDTPFSFSTFVPCAAGEAGEVIDVRGILHTVVSLTANGNNFIETVHFNPVNMVGTGETTGDKYIAAGPSEFAAITVSGSSGAFTMSESIALIGTTPGAAKLFLHVTAHITVDTKGVTTANFDKMFLACD